MRAPLGSPHLKQAVIWLMPKVMQNCKLLVVDSGLETLRIYV